MLLITNISVDHSLNTTTLTCTHNGNQVETIIYESSSNQITFLARPDVNIDYIDLLLLCDQISVFHTLIITNYNPNVFQTNPFGSCTNTENHDTILNKLNLVCIYGSSPRVCNYSLDLSSLIFTFNNRSGNKTLYFPEWLYFLQALNHYRLSVKGI